MNKRLIERLIQQRVTGIKSHDGYFFRTDFEHILRGVLLEYVPRGVYVTNFLFPLFDPVGPNLMYSNRTERSHWTRGRNEHLRVCPGQSPGAFRHARTGCLGL